MKVLFDTNVMVASVLSSHVHHPQAAPWLDRVVSGELQLVLSAHTLAEFYSILTRYPKNAVSPLTANALVQDTLVKHAEVIPLSTNDYLNVLKSIADRQLTGGTVFDALIIEVAKISKVDRIVTFNLKHFLKVWPEGASIILSP
jgi:predicted nucleic acid-binding protein